AAVFFCLNVKYTAIRFFFFFNFRDSVMCLPHEYCILFFALVTVIRICLIILLWKESCLKKVTTIL
ncbi:hypothetical protein L9F63_001464, partial [Diploptera punctata]